jgi:hypothetical protein
MLLHSSKLAQITSSKALFPSSPRQNTGADAARRGLRRNASLKAPSLSSALPLIVKQKLHQAAANGLRYAGSAFIALSWPLWFTEVKSGDHGNPLS